MSKYKDSTIDIIKQIPEPHVATNGFDRSIPASLNTPLSDSVSNKQLFSLSTILRYGTFFAPLICPGSISILTTHISIYLPFFFFFFFFLENRTTKWKLLQISEYILGILLYITPTINSSINRYKERWILLKISTMKYA